MYIFCLHPYFDFIFGSLGYVYNKKDDKLLGGYSVIAGLTYIVLIVYGCLVPWLYHLYIPSTYKTFIN